MAVATLRAKRHRAHRVHHRRGKQTAAAAADRHELYERSVQDPETDVETLAWLYKKFGGAEARVLREDFCGTGVLAAEWAASHPSRRAVGVDLDAETLAWGRRRHLEARDDVGDRVELLCADVTAGQGRKGDVTCAFNFSYCAFKSRSALIDYFRAVRRRLNAGGIFALDVLGGTESMLPVENETDFGDFSYRWEQESFDPLTHDMTCHIHFDFPDGSALERAFSYDWRLWTVPELRDALEESGFSKVHRLWERTDRHGNWTGKFYEPKHVENQLCWWTYIVAQR